MAVNPSYPEPDTSSAVSNGTQNPRYGEEQPEEPSEPLEEPGQGEPEEPSEPGQGEPEEPEELDESFTHAELDEIAAERDVDFPANLNKAEKIELLNSL